MEPNFLAECHLRHDAIDGVGPWVWVADDIAAWDILPREWTELKIGIRRYVKNFEVVVQGGGCMGMYPRLLSQMFKQVYTFEPHPLNFHCLVGNCQNPNIIKFQAALSSSASPATMNENDYRNSGQHWLGETNPIANTASARLATGIQYPIQTMTIDSLNLTKCDLLMLDVEKFELQALQGSLRTIQQHHPTILCEFAHENGIEPWLNKLGYEKRETILSDTFFTCS